MMEDAEFRGYVKATLDALKGDIKELKDSQLRTETKQESCLEAIATIRAKTTRNSGVIAVVVSVLGTALGGFIKHLLEK